MSSGRGSSGFDAILVVKRAECGDAKVERAISDPAKPDKKGGCKERIADRKHIDIVEIVADVYWHKVALDGQRIAGSATGLHTTRIHAQRVVASGGHFLVLAQPIWRHNPARENPPKSVRTRLRDIYVFL